ncbi:DUF4411 family protein [bacterium]|nr:DUF4411 family protein [bacterium]
MNEPKEKVYCFDSSIFIGLNRIHGFIPMPDIWEELDHLFLSGRLISHIFVYNEFNPDFLGKWAKDREKYFMNITENQFVTVSQILARFDKLIDPNKEKNQADPWIIALAMEKNQENSLFGQNKEYYVVSRESPRSAIKIPAVCDAFTVPHMTLDEFLEDNGWRLGIIKS